MSRVNARSSCFARCLILAAECSLALGAFSVTPPHAAADDPAVAEAADRRELGTDEKLAVLEMLDLQMRGNYEQIVTWKGAYRYIDRHRFDGEVPGLEHNELSREEAARMGLPRLNRGEIPTGKEAGSGHWDIGEGLVTFSLDRVNDKYHVFFEPDQPRGFIDVETGKEYRWKTFGDAVHWVFTPHESLEFDIRHKIGQIPNYPPVPGIGRQDRTRIVYRRTLEGGRLESGRVFRVRDLFSGFGWFHWETCRRYADELAGKNGPDAKARLEKRSAMYATTTSPLRYIHVVDFPSGSRTTIVYDSASGFNVVESLQYLKGNNLHQHQKVAYRVVDGIFVPESFEYRRLRPSGGTTRLEALRTGSLESITLNEEIPESEFGTASFGLVYGERMLDEIEGRMMVYDDKKGFVPVEKFEFDPVRANAIRAAALGRPDLAARREHTRGRPMLLIANGISVAAIARVAAAAPLKEARSKSRRVAESQGSKGSKPPGATILPLSPAPPLPLFKRLRLEA